ncbi:MAG: acyltransferase [Myxococcota bacterium]
MRQQRFYDPGLDVVRAVACLLVVVHHVTSGWLAHHPAAWLARSGSVWARLVRDYAAGGGVGVIYFYTLSAFLLSALVLMEAESTGSVDLRKFWIRRCLRIWPLYFTYLLSLALLQLIWPDSPALPGGWATLSLFGFVYNWVGWLASTASSFASILWSVCVEEQFYGLFTLGIWLAGPKRLGVLALVCVVLAPLSRAAIALAGLRYPAVWMVTSSHLDAFGLGTLAAVAWSRRRDLLPRKLRAPAVILALLAPALLAEVAGIGLYGGFWAVGSYTCFALLTLALIFGLLDLPWPDRGLVFAVQRVLVWIGRRAYGIYVFHWFFVMAVPWSRARGSAVDFDTLDAGAVILGTAVVAGLSYRFLESPALELKRKFAIVGTTPKP